jgi:hypothetical protein
MNPRTKRLVALAGALAISLAAAGCSATGTATTGASTDGSAEGSSGSSSSPGDSSSPNAGATTASAADVLNQAQTNALDATSGAFKGTVEDGGTKTSIDFKGTSDGKSADIAISRAGDGQARYIVSGGNIYIQGDETFWKKQNAPAKVLAAPEKFVKAPSAAQSVTETLTLKPFLSKIFSALTGPSVAPTATSETVDGIDCWVITDTKGKSQGALYVAKDGYEVVRFTGSTGSPGQLDFSQWNEDLGIRAPDPSQVLTLP